MTLTRYQTPDMSLWQSFDRWANLRDEVNNFFEGPAWATPTQAQLFNGWTPALDVYQTNDDVVTLVELPGMQKEDIELSLQDGILTISGERKDEIKEEDKAARSERFVGRFRRSISLPDACRRRQGQRHLQGWYPHRDTPEGGRGQAKADTGKRQLILLTNPHSK